MSEHPLFLSFLLILEKERKAILAGDFDTIDTLASDKAKMFDALPKDQSNESNLSRIKKVLDRNQMLLQAAISGVNSARARLLELREVRENLRVYDRSGQFSAHSSQMSEMNKRT